MQDVISSRKLNKYRSPELGRSTFEKIILVNLMVQCKRIRCNQNCTKFTIHRIVLKRFKQQVVDGRRTYKEWVRVKYTGEAWKEEGKWGNLNFCGWVVWWNI